MQYNALTFVSIPILYSQGRMQDLPRGGPNFLRGVGRVACREAACDAWLSHAFARGILGNDTPDNYFLTLSDPGYFRQ